MNIQDALKVTGKAKRQGLGWFIEECKNGEHEYRAIHLTSGGVLGYEIAIHHVLAIDWSPYHEVKEIRPERAGELWDKLGQKCLIFMCESGGRGIFWDDRVLVAGLPNDDGHVLSDMIHNKNGWTRLFPPVEDKNVERIEIDNVTFEKKMGWIVPLVSTAEYFKEPWPTFLNKSPMKMILEFEKETL